MSARFFCYYEDNSREFQNLHASLVLASFSPGKPFLRNTIGEGYRIKAAVYEFMTLTRKRLVQIEKNIYRQRYFNGRTKLQRSCWYDSEILWKAARKIILEPVDKDGAFLDVGCANGVLLRDLCIWAREEKGIKLVPYGIDFLTEAIEESKKIHPRHASNFKVAEMMAFRTCRKFTFIHSEPYGPRNSIKDFLSKYLNMLQDEGKLIVSFYDHKADKFLCLYHECRKMARKSGFSLAVRTDASGFPNLIWFEKRPPVGNSRNHVLSSR
jgi:hypothetical protein